MNAVKIDARPTYDPAVKLTPLSFVRQLVAEVRYDFAKKN